MIDLKWSKLDEHHTSRSRFELAHLFAWRVMSDLLCHLIFHEGIVAKVKVGLSIRESIIYVKIGPTCLRLNFLFFFDLNNLFIIDFEWLFLERDMGLIQLTYIRRPWCATSTFWGFYWFLGALLSANTPLIRHLVSVRWGSEPWALRLYEGGILR